ncbi:hypothetical protein [Pseudomonas sp. Teo4]|uniref:hypothetical protein n=1 Tax=Pseudomonas sp. Teo4 TaxID=3064528 RepID=UPI002ABBB1AA|nr:hypothetical protein [Pseudomonas sp. Teo4]MDZ3993717.1 hypothetical protein [Pseudomonas sp. Teo4]
MEFYDVKMKDFIELAGVPPHEQGKVVAEQRVKWRLREMLERHGITVPVEQLLFNDGNSAAGYPTSTPLVKLLTDNVINSEHPYLAKSDSGLYTTENKKLDIKIDALQEVVTVVYEHIKKTEQAG